MLAEIALPKENTLDFHVINNGPQLTFTR
jgi:hypothetical protein